MKAKITRLPESEMVSDWCEQYVKTIPGAAYALLLIVDVEDNLCRLGGTSLLPEQLPPELFEQVDLALEQIKAGKGLQS